MGIAKLRVAYFQRAFFGQRLEDRLQDLGIEFVPFLHADELMRLVASCDALVFPEPFYTPEFISLIQPAAARVRMIQFSSAGYETAIRYGIPRGIRTANGANVWGPTVSEHAATLALAGVRRINELERARQAKKWVKGPFITPPGQPDPEPGIIPHMGTMDGAEVGILGYGLIGQGVAARLKAFGANIRAYNRTVRDMPHADSVIPLAELPKTIGELDVVISCLPMTPDTDGMINADLLAKTKEKVTLVNVGRGTTIVDEALVDWLKSRPLSIAALDVYRKEPLPASHPFWEIENIILSPHVAGYGGMRGVERLVALCRENLARIDDGTEMRNAIRSVPILERT